LVANAKTEATIRRAGLFGPACFLERRGLDYRASVPLETIVVPENRLREPRDHSGLAQSMGEVGLLQPITVTEANVLVAGRHRLEAARSLGWKTIPAFVVEDDDLENRLREIDENLKRLDLTVWEQSKHAEERERVLEAKGERARRGDNRHSRPATVAGLDESTASKTTADVAEEVGMSERSWRQRTKIGRSLGPKTRAALDQADPEDEKQRNFLNSTTQLNTVADIANKRGDERAADAVERVLNGEHKNIYDAYPEVKRGQTVGDVLASGEDFEVPPRKLSPEQKAFYDISAYLVRLRRMDAEKVAAEWLEEADDFEARQQVKDALYVADWFGRYAEAIRNVSNRKLRVAGEE